MVASSGTEGPQAALFRFQFADLPSGMVAVEASQLLCFRRHRPQCSKDHSRHQRGSQAMVHGRRQRVEQPLALARVCCVGLSSVNR
jgi:hypothetical protein